MHNPQPLRKRAIKGFFWSAVDKFALQGMQFIVGIILARLLLPEDFGIIGMLSIFFVISQAFIDSGMASGLIQKKDRSDIDYSTVFVFNLIVSCGFYAILFFSSPYIALFYDVPQLSVLTKVLGLNIIISSFTIVQRTRLSIDLDFKTIAKIHIVSVILSGIIAVFLAYQGWGVWVLVVKNMANTIIALVLFWLFVEYKPSLKFSKKSFKDLFNFGSRLLIARLYAQTLQNVYSVIIGKYFSAMELGYYTKAKSFAQMTTGTISGVLQKVTFPILASLQNDTTKMVSVYSRLIRMTAFFVIPLMTLLSLLAEPLILTLLTDKWAQTIPLLQWMCFAQLFYPISAINMNIMNATGRSDLSLKVDLSRFPVFVITLLITVPLGIKAIVIGHFVRMFIGYFFTSYMPGRLFGYGPIEQFKDMIRILLATGIMSVAVWLVVRQIDLILLKLLVGGILGLTVFVAMAYLLKIEELKEIYKTLGGLVNRK